MSLAGVDVDEVGLGKTETHPVDVIVDAIGGEGRIFLGWLAAVLVIAKLTPGGSPWAAWVFFAGVLAMFGFMHRDSQEATRRSEIHELQLQYAEGEIGLDSFEDRVEVSLDPGAKRVRDFLDEEVDGIGTVLGSEVALDFRSVDEVRAADVDELTRVDGIGDERARTIVEEVRP